MDLLERMDRFVHVTRLDALTPYRERRRRNLRWLPLSVLIAIPISYIAMLLPFHGFGLEGDWRSDMWLSFAAGAVFWLAFGAAHLMRLFGPPIVHEAGQLDEREEMLRARARSASGFAVTVFAVGACFYGGFASAFGTWMPRNIMEWVYLGLAVEAYALILPVWVASWLQPEPEAEE